MDPELFGRLVVGIHAHIAYDYGQGWTMWVNSRLEGEPFTDGRSEQYGPLELQELLDVLAAVLPAAYLGSRYPT